LSLCTTKLGSFTYLLILAPNYQFWILFTYFQFSLHLRIFGSGGGDDNNDDYDDDNNDCIYHDDVDTGDDDQ